MVISTVIVSKMGGYYRAMPCEEIEFIYTTGQQEGLRTDYPQCFALNGTMMDGGWVAVKAKFGGGGVKIPEIGAALGTTFGTAGWLALLVHAVGVEIYLHLTPRENQRLRKISYQRQLEAGVSHPGSAGLTVDRVGDAEAWEPPRRSEPETVVCKE